MDELVEKFAVQYEGKLLEFLDFCNVLDNLKKDAERHAEVDLPQHWMDDLKEVFAVFDPENLGFIDKSELPLAMRCLRLKVTEEELSQLIPIDGNFLLEAMRGDSKITGVEMLHRPPG